MSKLFRRATAYPSDRLEAHNAQRRGAVLLDVREAAEWRSGHARGGRATSH